MMELTASQPVLINRGMLYLDWNLGDPTPWGHHLASTSRLRVLESLELASHRVPARTALLYFYTCYFRYRRVLLHATTYVRCTRPADAAFIFRRTDRPHLFLDIPWLMFVFRTTDNLWFAANSTMEFSSDVTGQNGGFRIRRSNTVVFVWSRMLRQGSRVI